MTRTPLLIVLGAAAALAGCNKGTTIVEGGHADDNLAENAPVVLPPTIAQSKIYRCADNGIVYVDWLSDNKSANLRIEQGAAPTQVIAPEPGKPMTGGGYSLTGTSAGSSITLVHPGHGPQTCHV